MSTILIVYEREMEQNALEKALSERGHTVVRAGNGMEALEAARRDPPHMVISDILLPKMDGFALCKKWKQDERLQPLPFMFYTRKHDEPKYKRFATELSADCFMERSTDRLPLLQAVEELLTSGNTARKLDPVQAQALGTGAFLVTSRISTAPEIATTTFETPPVVAAPVLSTVSSAAAPAMNGADHGQVTQGEDRSVAREMKLMARVSELDALNKQLQASEQKFRQLFDASPIPLWLMNGDDRRCTAVNNAALTLYGYTHSEFLALPRGEPPFIAGAAIASSGATWHRTKSGSAIAVELMTRMIDLGSKRGEIVAAHDATQKVFSERATAHAGDAYQALLIAAADGFWLLDDQNHILDVNEAYCRMSGYSRDELLKLAPNDLETRVGSETSIRLQQQITDQKSYESIHRRKDGTLYPVEVSVGSLTGARARTVLLIRDATVRQQQVQTDLRILKAQQAALELLNNSADLDEASVHKRALELSAAITASPVAFFCGVADAGAAPMLLAVFEQSRGQAIAVSGDARKLRGKNVSAECLDGGRAIVSNDGLESERSTLLPAQQTLLMLPIERSGEPLGVLAIANRTDRYSNADVSILSPIVEALVTVLLSKRKQASSLMVAQRAEAALQSLMENLGKDATLTQQ